MKKSYVIVILFVCVGICCYFVSYIYNIIETAPISKNPIYKNDYLSLFINAASGVATFLAVIVALFREDIRKLWEFSKIKVCLPSGNLYEQFNRTLDNSDPGLNETLVALQYFSNIDIHNSGNLSAEDLEIHLEELQFMGSDYQTEQKLIIETIKLKWSETDDHKITLSADRHFKMKIVEFIGPETQSSPNGQTITIPTVLKIGGVENKNEFRSGTWTASVAIYPRNSKPHRFKLVIRWNGKWESRASEMKHNYSMILIH